ncbi:MAG: hypothetical protein KDB27_35750, partial [Planctomycetales bacterium]|nr:hypothetical protein [Planctomycetales bacterium]
RIDGSTLLHQTVFSQSPRHLSPKPLTISASGQGFLWSVVVRRDVYYLPHAPNDATSPQRWKLAGDEYFVLGDYGDFSLDSRSSQIGTVPRDAIVGVVKQFSARR